MKQYLHFDKNIKRWDEAVPLGNGRIGALLWGNTEELRFSLDRTDIWDFSEPLNTEREDFTYENMVKLARAGDTAAIRELYDAPYNYPTPTKLPAGKLLFNFLKGKNVFSVLDLKRAEAILEIETEDVKIPLKAICHAVSKSGMIWIGTDLSKFKIQLQNPEFGNCDAKEALNYDPENREISQGDLKRLHYPEPEKGSEKDDFIYTWFLQKVDEEFSFGIVVGISEGINETQIFYRIVTSKDGENWMEDAKEQLRRELNAGYEEEIKSHLC